VCGIRVALKRAGHCMFFCIMHSQTLGYFIFSVITPVLILLWDCPSVSQLIHDSCVVSMILGWPHDNVIVGHCGHTLVFLSHILIL